MVQTQEYLVAPLVAGKPQKWQEELNRLAEEGWDLSDVIAIASGMISLPGKGPIEAVAFLKRPIAE